MKSFICDVIDGQYMHSFARPRHPIIPTCEECIFSQIVFDFDTIWTGLGKLYGVVRFMLPPASHGRFLVFLKAIFETLGMAFLGTLLAALIALPTG